MPAAADGGRGGGAAPAGRHAAARTREELAASEATNEALRHANAELDESRAALAAREEQLRLALDAARMATWEWDAATGAVTGSTGREALYGRPVGSLGTIAAVLEAVHPEDRDAAAATIQRAMDRPPGDREFDAIDFRVAGQDGSICWLRAQGRVTLRDPVTGRALQGAGVTYDITDRKRTEAALRDAEERYRVLFEAAPFGVIVIDPATHRVLDVNPWACAEYGYTPEEFRRLCISDIDALTGGSQALRQRGRQHVIRPGTQEFEARHRTRSGELRDVLVRVQGVRLGGREVSYGAHIDITARKAAEARLARLAAILEATPDFVAIAEPGTLRCTYLNAAFRRLRGLAPEDAIGELSLLECHPPEVARMLAEVAAPAATRDGSWTGEGAVLAADGRVIPVSHVVLAHRVADGSVESWSVIMRDLSERQRAEEERQLLTREVDHRAKNALAVVQAALRLTPKRDAESFAHAVEGRVMALARAHSLLAAARWSGAWLGDVVQGELAPFTDGQAQAEGPPLLLKPAAVQGFSMALHELATNATKHGALSTPEGRVSLRWWLDKVAGEIYLRWTEQGGPPVSGPPAQRGFGSRLLEATLRDQLGGRVEYRWESGGLVCDIALPMARTLAAG